MPPQLPPPPNPPYPVTSSAVPPRAPPPVAAPSLGAGTFDGQDKLPKLPIPKLEDTAARYLKIVAPLLSAEQLERTKAAVAKFVASDGPTLQRKLQEYAADRASYIEDFWFHAYLTHEDSVVLSLNPYFVLANDPTPSNNDQITRAASLVLGAV